MRWNGWMTGVALAAMFAAGTSAAQPNDKAEIALRAAMEKETVEGDLKNAIEQYKKLARNSNRAVAARALVRLGECYEKQGGTDARTMYERVVSSFGEQKEAVARARTRLAVLGAGASGQVRMRLVLDNVTEDLWGSVSADGRYLSQNDWRMGGELCVTDLVTSERHLFSGLGEYAKGKGEPGGSAISPDGKRVAYAYLKYAQNRKRITYNELHLMNTDGSGHRVLFRDEGLEYLQPHSWSMDGTSIVAVAKRDAKISLLVISPDTANVRDIPMNDDAGRGRVVFSPDGKWLAYTRYPKSGPNQLSLISASATSGPEVVLQENAVIMGWTPDGAGLLFLRERAGAGHLYLLPVSQGKPADEAKELHGALDAGSIALGVTSTGALLTGTFNARSDASIFQWNGNAESLKNPAVTFAAKQDYVLELSGGGIRFSPDGKQVFGMTLNGGVLFHDLASGRQRTVTPQLSSMTRVEWTHDGTNLLVTGVGADGVSGLYRVDSASGAASLVAGDRVTRPFAPSPDGRKIFYSKRNTGIFAYDLGSGEEKLLLAAPEGGNWSDLRVSHDGAKLAVKGNQRLAVIELASGQAKEIYHSPKGSPEMIWALEWGADDRQLLTIFRVTANIDRMDLVKIPAAGGAPVRQPIDKQFRGLSISRDGKYLATARLRRQGQVWALENFLPVAAARKQ